MENIRHPRRGHLLPSRPPAGGSFQLLLAYPFKARYRSLKIVARSELRTSLRRLTSARRTMPDLLIIGAQRGGTTSLFNYLQRHPDTEGSFSKEVEYFTTNYRRGEAWYRAHFPIRDAGVDTPLTFEASPSYLFDPRAASRAFGLLPDVRLVALLRDPVKRAFSHYQLMVSLGFEKLSFEAAIAQEPHRLQGEFQRMEENPLYKSRAHRRYSYLGHSCYDVQIARWLDVYPRHQLLVLRSEDFYHDPASNYAKVLRFVDLPVGRVDLSAVTHPLSSTAANERLSPRTEGQLREYFAPHNDRLASMLGDRFDW